jgi:uncharacterized pyridoxamine 5'-phosphate oxidase family protein
MPLSRGDSRLAALYTRSIEVILRADTVMDTQTTWYQFRIEGRLGSRWASWFEGLTLRHGEGDETVLSGAIQDQAALHGVLMKIRDLGLPLIEVRRMDPGTVEGFSSRSHSHVHTEKESAMTRDEAVAYIKDVEFGYVATVGADGAPRVRPVAIKDIYGDSIYFFTFRNTRKVAEVATNPNVEVVWSKPGSMSQVRIRGTLAEETDGEIQAQFKADNPMVSRMLPPGAEGLFLLYRLSPETVEMAKTLGPYEQLAW